MVQRSHRRCWMRGIKRWCNKVRRSKQLLHTYIYITKNQPHCHEFARQLASISTVEFPSAKPISFHEHGIRSWTSHSELGLKRDVEYDMHIIYIYRHIDTRIWIMVIYNLRQFWLLRQFRWSEGGVDLDFFFSEVSHPDEPRVTQMEILLCGSTGIYNDLDNSSICTILVCWKWTRKPNWGGFAVCICTGRVDRLIDRKSESGRLIKRDRTDRLDRSEVQPTD